MSAREFMRWRALESVDPWGQTRADWHNAAIRHAIAAGNGSRRDLGDFVLRFVRKPRQTAEQMERTMRGLVAMGLATVRENANG